MRTWRKSSYSSFVARSSAPNLGLHRLQVSWVMKRSPLDTVCFRTHSGGTLARVRLGDFRWYPKTNPIFRDGMPVRAISSCCNRASHSLPPRAAHLRSSSSSGLNPSRIEAAFLDRQRRLVGDGAVEQFNERGELRKAGGQGPQGDRWIRRNLPPACLEADRILGLEVREPAE